MAGYARNENEVESPDGLPVVQPTRERVDEALAYTDRDPEDSLGAVPPMYGEATVEKVATNTVMAGARPEYLPVVLAGVEAMLREEFNLYGVLSTTHPCWPVLMVNGPIARELEINDGRNALGQGFRANATIGRAITMVCMNVGGAVPGQSDDATHGGPQKFGLCFAEDADANPWEPFHVERGYDADTSTVTVFGAEGPHNINDHVSRSAPNLLTTCADTMATVGTNLMYLNERGEPHLNLGPEHAEVVAEDGWTKQDVKRFIYDQARIPKRLFDDRGMDFPYEGESTPWATHFNVAEAEARVGLCASPEDVIVTVCGGPGRQSFWLPTFGDTTAQTAAITDADGTPVEAVEALRS